MNKNSDRMIRCGMYILIMMPLYALVTRVFTVRSLMGPLCLCALALVSGFIAMMPRYVGDYNETEVIRYEGGANKGDDPNPDRESRHETIREGRRFPLRNVLYAVCALVTLILLLLIPEDSFTGDDGLYRMGFIALSMALEIGCMASINSDYCVWTELPGVILGFLGYVAVALVFHFSDISDAAFKLTVGIFALLFIFGGFVCLNRASLNAETGRNAEDNGVPDALRRRNRRVVLIFASLIAVISFVKPVRDAALWVLRWIAVFFRWLAWLLRGGQEVDKGDLNRLLEMQGLPQEPILPEESEELIEEVEELKSSVWDKVLVYVFFTLLACGLIFIIYSHAVKKIKRDGYLFKRKRKLNAEGYYDEREELESDEIRKKYAGSLRDRIKNAFRRETPWEKLTGRERARRLVKQLYRKRRGKIENLPALTVNEALEQMMIDESTARKTADAYDLSRYSEHEVDAKDMDRLKKELRL